MRERVKKGDMTESPDTAVCACCGRSYSVKEMVKRAFNTESGPGMLYVQWRCRKGTKNNTAIPIAKRRKM